MWWWDAWRPRRRSTLQRVTRAAGASAIFSATRRSARRWFLRNLSCASGRWEVPSEFQERRGDQATGQTRVDSAGSGSLLWLRIHERKRGLPGLPRALEDLREDVFWRLPASL